MPQSVARRIPLLSHSLSRAKPSETVTPVITTYLFLGAVLLGAAASPAVMAEDTLDQYDWHPTATLPPAQQAQVRPGCRGLYIDPLKATSEQEESSQAPRLRQKIDNAQLDIFIEADYATVSGGNQAELSGDVKVSRGTTSLSAGIMQYDRDADIAELKGGVEIRQPGLLIRGDSAMVEIEKNRSEFKGAKFVLHESHIRGSAEFIGQVTDDVVTLRNGMITSCEPGEQGWTLEGDELSVNQASQMGTGKNVRLKVGGVPILYLPYITYPVGDQRKSGFLPPSPSSSENGGLDIALPYYWNIAPNYDATFTPRLISSQGVMVQSQFRHLNTWGEGDINVSFLKDDKGGGDQDIQDLIDSGDLSEAELKPNKGKDRWLFNFKQHGGQTRGLYINNDYSKVSDIDYFRDLGNTSFAASNNSQLNQILQLGYQNDHWDFGVRTESHQVLLEDIDNPYQSLPQINADGFYNIKNFSLTLDNEFTQFDSTSDENELEGLRMVQDYRLRWDNRNQWGFIIPEIGYKNLNYDVNLSETEDLDKDKQRQQYDALQSSVDMGIKFERDQGNYIHTFEPRFFYLYREYVDQSNMFNLEGEQDINFDTVYRTFSYDQLFRDSRYIGSDRIDDANQYTLGLSSRLFRQDTGEEAFRLSLGKIYYLDERQVSLQRQVSQEDLLTDSSELALETAFKVIGNTQIILNGLYDTKNNDTKRSSGRIHYANKNYSQIYNLSYVYKQGEDDTAVDTETIEQLSFSTALQLTPSWALMGRTNYDLQNKRELETFAGLEYDDCCYRVRFLGRKWLDSNIAAITDDESAQFDIGFYFELELKGFGGSGAKINSILSEGIFGFDERNNHRK